MASAIKTLPWVESDSVKADGSALQVKFTVKDPKEFDEEAVVKVLKDKGYSGSKKLTGPTTE